ncbi:MAG: hypothetical protein QW096_12155 [Thermofilaceae archaeon]
MTLICLVLILLSGTMLIIGYKLIRYESIIKRTAHDIQKIVNKYYNNYISEVLKDFNIIVFSGVDGSGKTTQVKLLKTFLNSKHVKARVFWFRWTAFFSYYLYLYAILTRRTLRVKVGDRKLKIHIFYMDGALGKLYPTFQLIDFWLKYLALMVYIKIKRIHVVIFDRFILDLIVDLLWETRNHTIFRNMLLRILIGKMMKWRTIIFTAEIPTVVNRKTDVLNVRELLFKKRVFSILAEKLNIPIIDTSHKSKILTFKELLQRLQIPHEML